MKEKGKRVRKQEKKGALHSEVSKEGIQVGKMNRGIDGWKKQCKERSSRESKK